MMNDQPLARSAGAAWGTVGACTYGLTFGPNVLTILNFAVFVAPLQREFGWGIPAISLGASLISLMIVVISPLQGFAVDRFGSRRTILFSIPPFGASLCLMALLPNDVRVFYLAWVVVCVAGFGVWATAYLRATAGWFETRLGLALGVANAGIGVGSAVVPLVTATLIAQHGWREAFMGLGILALTAWPVVFLFLREPARRSQAAAAGGSTVGQAVSTRTFQITLAAFVLLGIFGAGVVVHQVRLLIDAGIPPGSANLVPVVLGVALICARVGTGWLLDRFAISRIMPLFLAGGALATTLYALTPSLPQAILCSALAGLVMGAEFDVLSYLIPRYFGRRSFGTLYGIVFAVFQLSSAVAIYGIGVSREAFGSYAPAMWTLTGACVLCAGLFLMLGPYPHGAADAGTRTEPDRFDAAAAAGRLGREG